jgi:hypothetical protein
MMIELTNISHLRFLRFTPSRVNCRLSSVVPLLAVLSLAFLFSCGTDSSLPKINERLYYPLRVGDFRIYKINETKIKPFDLEEIFNYEVKTVVTDSFANASGAYSYIVQRYKRTTTTSAWESLDTWSARADEKEVVVSEGNVPFVKLSFPVQSDREWNGNAYNNQESNEFCEGSGAASCDLYAFGQVNKTYTTTGGLSFDNTIEVIQNNNLDIFVERNIRKEIYGWEVGLVFREITILKYCTKGPCSGKQMVEDGLILKQELTAYGRE